MEIENVDINVDEFLPPVVEKSVDKYDKNEDTDGMEVEETSEVKGASKILRKTKKTKSSGESRRITVPLNRLNNFFFF